MTQDHMTKITVFHAEDGDTTWPFSDDARLADVAAWFNTKWFEVPLEYSTIAKCEIGTSDDYQCASITISYERPETASERVERLAATENLKAEQRERELVVLRALQAKYPSQT